MNQNQETLGDLKNNQSSGKPPTAQKQKTDQHPLQSSLAKSPKSQSKILADQTTHVRKPTIDDFITICQLGRGSYGEVVLGKQKSNDQEYAIKVIDKKFMAKEKKQYQVFIEREMLFYLRHAGVAHIYSTFQTSLKLYFVMEYLDGGDFSEFIKLNQKNLKPTDIQFYAAEILIILEFLHSKGIAHRDVKPENILLTNQSHLKMIDFGTAAIYDESRTDKFLAERIREIRTRYKPEDKPKEEIFGREEDNKHRATFVGTAEYVSPELLDDDICQGPADLWALGCIIFKLFTGKTPFYENSEYMIFNNIKQVKYSIPESVPEVAASLIKELLLRDPQKRLGAGQLGSSNDYNALKSHKFFSGIDFENIWDSNPPKFQSYKLQRDTMLDPDLQLGQAKPEEKKKKSKLLFYGLVQLKTGWFNYKPVELVLCEGKQFMNLIFYDPETEKTKCKIQLSDNVKLYQPEDGKIVIQIDCKDAHTFKEIEHPANKWLEIIDKSRAEKKRQQQFQT